ncbi:hypothetical protein [Levilactobacillus bambusae]|uniref:Uncharacterized protein n=1 Tax=Levilactobacillus bambusae TaxID=2024736 RepID=A0A2V1N268_9LACO|nr:hypothetical protein [Levilactobacillus bambusae]PWG00310.1 hypothetical protein DCM90_05105 [Levilactobacillus bambusae]
MTQDLQSLFFSLLGFGTGQLGYEVKAPNVQMTEPGQVTLVPNVQVEFRVPDNQGDGFARFMVTASNVARVKQLLTAALNQQSLSGLTPNDSQDQHLHLSPATTFDDQGQPVPGFNLALDPQHSTAVKTPDVSQILQQLNQLNTSTAKVVLQNQFSQLAQNLKHNGQFAHQLQQPPVNQTNINNSVNTVTNPTNSSIQSRILDDINNGNSNNNGDTNHNSTEQSPFNDNGSSDQNQSQGSTDNQDANSDNPAGSQ